MKRIISIAAVVMMMAGSLFAQPQQGKGKNHKDVMEKVQAEKVAYLTSKMDLSVEESQAFWPVYNKVQKANMEAMARSREAFRNLHKALKEGASDAEVAKLIKDYEAAQAQAKKATEGNTAEYLKVLPASKVAKLIIAEEDFRKQHIGGHQGGPGNGPQPQGFNPGKDQRPQGAKSGKGGKSGKGQKAPQGAKSGKGGAPGQFPQE